MVSANAYSFYRATKRDQGAKRGATKRGMERTAITSAIGSLSADFVPADLDAWFWVLCTRTA